MTYWAQNDKRLNPISEWGCYFISMVNLAQIITGKNFTDKDVIVSWFKNYQENDIDIESTILDTEGVLLDFGVKCKFIGKKPADYVCSSDEYEILDYFNPKTAYTHFVLGNGKGECLVDPFPGSRTVREGKVRSKRIFGSVEVL